VLTKQEIIRKAEILARDYFDAIGPEKSRLGISFDVAYEYVLYPEYGILLIDNQDLGFDEAGKKILGEFDPFERTAYIDVCLQPRYQDRRRAFTCWHEVAGHGILHGQWLRDNYDQFNSTIVTTEDTIELRAENLFEWQANLFAAHAAAPRWFVDRMILRTFELKQPFRYLGPGRYSYCVPGGTQYHEARNFHDVCYRVAQYIRPYFGGLSIEALSYHVAESRWIADLSGMESVPPPRPRLRRVASAA
jgi:hypothetical protein